MFQKPSIRVTRCAWHKTIYRQSHLVVSMGITQINIYKPKLGYNNSLPLKIRITHVQNDQADA